MLWKVRKKADKDLKREESRAASKQSYSALRNKQTRHSEPLSMKDAELGSCTGGMAFQGLFFLLSTERTKRALSFTTVVA